MRCTVLPNDFDFVLASSSRFIPQAPFVIYKGLVALFFLFWCIRWPLVDYYSIYLFVTYWAFYTGALYFLVSFVTACERLGKGGAKPHTSEYAVSPACEDAVPMPRAWRCRASLERRLFSVQMVAWNISCVGSLVVATVFWLSLYHGDSLTSVDINAHIFFAVIMLIDQMLVATRFRLRDLWVAELFSVTYLAFNITWYCTAPNGMKLIYSVLDWSLMPAEAAAYSAAVLLLLVPLFGVVHFGVFRLREFLYAGCQRRVASPPASLSDHLLAVGSGGSQQNLGIPPQFETGTDYVDV